MECHREPRFLAAILLSLTFAGSATADNNTHSNWTINISEGGMAPAPGIPDDLPEIAVVGSTVHILWLADDPAGSCSKCVIWYRRSRDNGKTWDPRVMIAAADKNLNYGYYGNRFMAVDNQNVVHIAWPTTSPTNGFDGWLLYRRSKDGGTTWDPVKNLYDVNLYPWWPDVTLISTDGVKTTIAANITSNRAAGGWIQLLTTADGGNTFTSASVFGTATTDGWELLDAKRAGDRTYVLYSDISNLYGNIAKDYVKVVPDSGAGLGPYLVSVPANDGQHHATLWQSNNYSPKIAVNADKAYVVFGCQDANSVQRSFMRRFYNYGANLDPTLITSDNDPDGTISSPSDVSVAANSSYAMMVYHVDTSDKYGGIAKIVVKRYSESQQAAVPAESMFGKQSYFRGSGQPTVVSGSGQNAYVMWQAPTLARTTDSFNTEIYPVEPQPLGTWAGTWPTRLKTTIGPDGTVHWVEVGAFKGNKADADILYGNWSLAPAPGATNMALSLTTSDSAYRYDAMEVPAGATTTNFKSAMTLAAWVQVQSGGSKPCCTDIVPIVSKQEYVSGDAYVLGTAGNAPGRFPVAAITTTANGFRIQPSGSQGVLTEGQWYHLAFTYDSAAGANNFNLYINGNLVAQGTATGQLATSDGPLIVGSLGNWTVDDLSLWNRALSPAEISQIKSGPLKGTESGLAVYFNFDNTTMALNNPNADGVLEYQESFIPSTWSTSQSACTFTLSSSSQSVSSAASSGTVNVTSGTGCAWAAVSNISWLHVSSGATGSGNGTVAYSVDANTAASSRTGTITIAGQTFTVTQAALPPCTYSIDPTSAQVSATAGTGSVAVAAAAGCAWTAISNTSWITITSGASGSGNGTVTYSVAANTTTTAQTGTLTVAGQTFTVTQAAATPCTYAIAPASASFPASGGSGTVNVTTGTACAWTASSPVSWITITSGASGTGSGSVNYSVAVNTSTSSRNAILTVAGQNHTVSQDAASATGAPTVTAGGVVNYADGSTTFAPGTLVVIGGDSLASDSELAGSGPLPFSLAGTSVDVDCGGQTVSAPILSASPSSLTVQLPYEAAGPTAGLRVRTATGASDWITIAVSPQAPRILVTAGTSPNLALAVHPDGTPVSADMPVAAGETVQANVIGLGITTPPATTGSGDPQASQFVVSGVSVTVGQDAANVVSAVLGPQPGIYLVSFQVPSSVASGNYSLTVSVGGQTSQQNVAMPAGSKEIMLYQLSNANACSLTDTAQFQLPQDAYVTRLSTWYNWSADEQSTPFHLLSGSQDILDGNLTQGACDPIQQNWCEAVAPVGMFLPSGNYALHLDRAQMCFNDASQDNGFATLWGAWQETWTPLTSVTVDASGGSIAANGFNLTLPAGTSAAATVNVSSMPGPFFRLENLGLADMAGATLQIALDPSMSGDVAIVAGEENTNHQPMILKATVNNGIAQATIPPIPSDDSSNLTPTAAGASRRSSRQPERPHSVIVDTTKIASRIGLLAGMAEEASPSGRFVIHFPVGDANEPYMDQQPISAVLEDASNKLAAIGVDTTLRKTPIDAYVYSFNGPIGRIFQMNQSDAGDSETNIWGAQDVGLSVNQDMALDPSQADEVRVTLGHELFHVYQALYDPRPWLFSTLQSEWLWFEEASATWFEKKVTAQPASYTPANTFNYRWYLLAHGLEYLSGSLSVRDPIMRHGYGAASFLESLYPVGVNETPIGDLTQLMSQRSGVLTQTWKYTPVEAIQTKELSLLPLKWRDYCAALMTGKVYPGINAATLVPPNPAAYPTLAIPTYTFTSDSDKGPPLDVWDAPDLSAHLSLLQFHNTNTSWNNVTLKITLTEPTGDAEVMAFTKSGGGVTLVGRSSSVLTIPNIETYAQNRMDLYVLTANGHAGAVPFNGTTHMVVMVQLVNPAGQSLTYQCTMQGSAYDPYANPAPAPGYSLNFTVQGSGVQLDHGDGTCSGIVFSVTDGASVVMQGSMANFSSSPPYPYDACDIDYCYHYEFTGNTSVAMDYQGANVPETRVTGDSSTVLQTPSFDVSLYPAGAQLLQSQLSIVFQVTATQTDESTGKVTNVSTNNLSVEGQMTINKR